MVGNDLPLQGVGDGAGDGARSGSNQRLRANRESFQHQKLITLYEDMYRWSSSIDKHFLKACNLSKNFKPLPPGVTEEDIRSFQAGIDTYETSYTANKGNFDVRAAISKTRFVDASHVERLWAPVNYKLGNSPVSLYNNQPPWTSWVMELDDLCIDLPEIILRIRQSPTQIYNDNYASWSQLRRKVAFIDEVLIYAYTNKFAAWPKKRTDIGKAINRRLADAGLLGSAIAKFTEIDLPKYLADRQQTPTILDENRKKFLVNSIYIVTIAVLIIAAVGLQYWTPDKGKTKDPSFFFLLASCILQLLGIGIIWSTAPYKFSRFEYSFIISAALFTIAPMVTWVFIATEYSLGLSYSFYHFGTSQTYEYFSEINFEYHTHSFGAIGHCDPRYTLARPPTIEETKKTLSVMMKSYAMTMSDLRAETFIAHGTRHWNQKFLPWDSDIDVQMSVDTLAGLVPRNISGYCYPVAGEDRPRVYLLDINPHYTMASTWDVANKIDARWSDTTNGKYIDITAVHISPGKTGHIPFEQGVLLSKDSHAYRVRSYKQRPRPFSTQTERNLQDIARDFSS
ncbi:mannosyltransferase [Exophiala xenobiotica]|nr:mannosyltransferase [Exophiala xenobiotica]